MLDVKDARAVVFGQAPERLSRDFESVAGPGGIRLRVSGGRRKPRILPLAAAFSECLGS
jgi:hypothetical protein